MVDIFDRTWLAIQMGTVKWFLGKATEFQFTEEQIAQMCIFIGDSFYLLAGKNIPEIEIKNK